MLTQLMDSQMGLRGQLTKYLLMVKKLDTLLSNLTIRRWVNFKDRNFASLAPSVTFLKKRQLNGSASAIP